MFHPLICAIYSAILPKHFPHSVPSKRTIFSLVSSVANSEQQMLSSPWMLNLTPETQSQINFYGSRRSRMGSNSTPVVRGYIGITLSAATSLCAAKPSYHRAALMIALGQNLFFEARVGRVHGAKITTQTAHTEGCCTVCLRLPCL